MNVVPRIVTSFNVDYDNARKIEFYYVADVTTVYGSIKIGNQTKTVSISFYEVKGLVQKINVIEENIDEDN